MYIQRTKYTYRERLKSFICANKKYEKRLILFINDILVHWNTVKIIKISFPTIHKIWLAFDK